MNPETFLSRLDRAANEVGRAGLSGLLVTPGADLAYLTGYAPMPLERLTLLGVAGDRPAVLLVPMLERPGALASPIGGSIEVLGWTDGDDPYERAAHLVPRGRLGVTDQTRFFIAWRRQLPHLAEGEARLLVREVIGD